MEILATDGKRIEVKNNPLAQKEEGFFKQVLKRTLSNLALEKEKGAKEILRQAKIEGKEDLKSASESLRQEAGSIFREKLDLKQAFSLGKISSEEYFSQINSLSRAAYQASKSYGTQVRKVAKEDVRQALDRYQQEMEEAQEIKNISPKGVSLEIGEEGFIEGISFKLLEGEARITQGSIKITLNGKMQIEKLLLETDKEADIYLKKVAFFKQVRVELQEDSTLKVSSLDERFWPTIFSTKEPSSIELPYPSVTVMRGIVSPGRGGGGGGGNGGGGGTSAQESFTADKGLQNLTNNPAWDYDPAWSPDGQKIAFRSNRDGNEEIYTMNQDGSSQTNLTNNPGDDFSPAYSPNGQKIAFTTRRDGTQEIYTMNAADGSSQTNLTNDPSWDYWPAWSPDGQKIAFGTNRDGNYEVYAMDQDGSNPTNLTNNGAWDYFPAYSPDGQKIAFITRRDGNEEIYTMNQDGSSQTNLTNNPGDDFSPAYSPNGQKIAFRSIRDGNFEVYIMNQDGSSQTNLTNDARGDYDPAYSPDGQKIAFAARRDGDTEIYVMNVANYITFTLANTPTSITSVTVNSNPVTEDPTNGWTLSGNQLTFNGTSLPNDDGAVAIDYQY